MKVFTNDELDKLELTFTFCKFLKEYYSDLYVSVYGYGDGGDYNFVRKFYYYLDNKDTVMLLRFYDVLRVAMSDLLDSIDNLEDIDNQDETLKQVRDIEYFMDKLQEYIY